MFVIDDDPLAHLSDDDIEQVLTLYEHGCCAEEIADTLRLPLRDVLCTLEVDEALFPDEPLRRVLN